MAISRTADVGCLTRTSIAKNGMEMMNPSAMFYPGLFEQVSTDRPQMGAQMSPLKRLGTPADIADVVVFIVSDQASWLTGQNIHTGGGVVM